MHLEQLFCPPVNKSHQSWTFQKGQQTLQKTCEICRQVEGCWMRQLMHVGSKGLLYPGELLMLAFIGN